MLQNIERLVTRNSKEKIVLIKDYVKEDNTILMNLMGQIVQLNMLQKQNGLTFLEMTER